MKIYYTCCPYLICLSFCAFSSNLSCHGFQLFHWLPSLSIRLFGFCHTVQSCWLDFSFYFLLFGSPGSSLYICTMIFLIVPIVALLSHVLYMLLYFLISLFHAPMCVFVIRSMCVVKLESDIPRISNRKSNAPSHLLSDWITSPLFFVAKR